MAGKAKEMINKLSYFKGKRVLITGHTGFKGSWLSYILLNAGAQVTGFSLSAPSIPSLFESMVLKKDMASYIGDIADLPLLSKVFHEVKPEIVFHLAAQPIVRESYKNPVLTYRTNVMGTVNVMECIRNSDNVTSFLNVTTDKVYKNREWEWGYRENEELCGYDPYSNSKSCSELVTYSYQKSFFGDRNVAISTARAGNVIGGGDFSVDRIIPDCVRAALNKENIILRNPKSIRPYQHVLEPILAYLMIAASQNEEKEFAGNYNIGPDEADCIQTAELVDLFCNAWKKHTDETIAWKVQNEQGPHEANFLKLDCARLKNKFDWAPVWHIEKAVDKTVEWYSAYKNGENIKTIIRLQLDEFIRDGRQ